jgi:hypothetical protein
MHLLCTFTAAPGFRAAFDAAAEERGQHGLSLLQMWHDADDATRVLTLFEVNDRARADTWVATARAIHGLTAAQFLRTA